MRRTQSMYQSSQDVMDQSTQDLVDSEISEITSFSLASTKTTPKKKITSSSSNLFRFSPNVAESASYISFLDAPDCPIDHFSIPTDPFKRITCETLCEIMDGKFNSLFDDFFVIDCRFEYEFEGGHIGGAINLTSHAHLEKKLLSIDNNTTQALTPEKPTSNRSRSDSIDFDPEKLKDKNILLVFHCELSSHRGPLMATHLRKCDRTLNINHYPHLNYPNILILQGGYKSFFEKYSNRCYPQQYVEMNDKSHINTCEREMSRFKKRNNFSEKDKHSRKWTRSKTYTYGFGKGNNIFSKSSPSLNNMSPSISKQKHDNKLDFSFKFPIHSNLNSSLNSSFTDMEIDTDEQEDSTQNYINNYDDNSLISTPSVLRSSLLNNTNINNSNSSSFSLASNLSSVSLPLSASSTASSSTSSSSPNPNSANRPSPIPLIPIKRRSFLSVQSPLAWDSWDSPSNASTTSLGSLGFNDSSIEDFTDEDHLSSTPTITRKRFNKNHGMRPGRLGRSVSQPLHMFRHNNHISKDRK